MGKKGDIIESMDACIPTASKLGIETSLFNLVKPIGIIQEMPKLIE